MREDLLNYIENNNSDEIIIKDNFLNNNLILCSILSLVFLKTLRSSSLLPLDLAGSDRSQ